MTWQESHAVRGTRWSDSVAVLSARLVAR